ncbi:MAG: type II secretion system protein GspG [Acidobacteriota bacterium]|nr:type II secretion system protein GspG [Acidobacteriota bacterium]
MNAINRGRQKRSMADIRTIGTAVEAYAVDMAFYPTFPEGPIQAASTITGNLEPTYVKTVPREDGWRTPFYAMAESRFYTLASAARDKLIGDLASFTAGITSDMDCDIVYSNGSFVQYPEGVQDDG